jgi:hypothetical protein
MPAGSLLGLRFRFAMVWLYGGVCVCVLTMEEKLKLETFFCRG